MQEMWVWSLVWEDPLEEGLATSFTIIAWKIPWTEEPGGLQCTELQRVRHDSTRARTHTHTHTHTQTVDRDGSLGALRGPTGWKSHTGGRLPRWSGGWPAGGGLRVISWQPGTRWEEQACGFGSWISAQLNNRTNSLFRYTRALQWISLYELCWDSHLFIPCPPPPSTVPSRQRSSPPEASTLVPDDSC